MSPRTRKRPLQKPVSQMSLHEALHAYMQAKHVGGNVERPGAYCVRVIFGKAHAGHLIEARVPKAKFQKSRNGDLEDALYAKATILIDGKLQEG